jgi:hypothetical protein
MSISTWTDADTAKALQLWADYQGQHDVSSLMGQTAGIDPVSGRIWFGESATDIWQQMEAEGIDVPPRVGPDYYVRKGGHSGSRPVSIEVPSEDNPCRKMAGMFKDDPLFDDWQQAIADYRRQVDDPARP